MNKRNLSVALVAVTLAGCTLEPKYQRPALPVSQTWPENSSTENLANLTNAVADIGWHEFFNDPRLQPLIGLALTNDRDLRVAILNVEKSRAQYRIERAALFPQIDATGSGLRQRLQADVSGTGAPLITSEYSASLGTASYELDLFGRVQSLKK